MVQRDRLAVLTPLRLLRASAVAAICCLVLGTRVFVAFAPLRIRLVKTPVAATAGTVRVTDTDIRLNDLAPPFAAIARIHTDSPAPQAFAIRLNDRRVCTRSLSTGSSRIDCTFSEAWERKAEHTVTVDGPNTPWVLEYLELATHHGHTTTGLNVFVVPAEFDRYTTASAVYVLLAWLALTALFVLPHPPLVSRALRVTYAALVVSTVVLGALVLFAPFVSPYRLIVSTWTWTGWLFLLLAPRVWRVLVLAGNLEATRPAVEWIGRAAERFWSYRDVREGWIAGALAVAVCVAGLVNGTRALGGSDTYGYVSQADLWLRGDLTINQSFATSVPWPDGPATFAPFGYAPQAANHRRIVPVYSPGLPLLLAAAKRLAGQTAMFYVVPLCGALLVLGTFGLGCRLGSKAVGLTGAWLVATSPVVLAHVMLTMTDVPVAAMWTAAFCVLLGAGVGSAAGAGLLAGMAILTRPNLAPLAGVLALHYVLMIRQPAAARRAIGLLLVFCTAVLPAVVAVAIINQHLFGSPLTSGYGQAGDLFDWRRIPTNLRLYLAWLGETHTPVVFVGIAAILVPMRRLWPGVRDRAVLLVLGLFVILLWATYCAWQVFDSWWFTRFLISSWPMIMLGIGAAAAALWRTGWPPIRPAVAVGVIALGWSELAFARSHGAFQVSLQEGRNVILARLTQQVTESNSVVLCGIHSGSIRYYSERMTLTFGRLDGMWLDRAVDWLTARGIHTYAALEDWEVPEFRKKFAGSQTLSALDLPPLGRFDIPGHAMVFDLTTPSSPTATPLVVTGVHTAWSAVPPGTPPQLVFKSTP